MALAFAFRRVRKVAKSDELRHVSPHVHMEKLGSQWTDFHEIWYFSIFPKKNTADKIQVSWKSDYMQTNIHFWSDLAQFFLEWDKSCRENQNTYFVSSNFFFSKIVSFMR